MKRTFLLTAVFALMAMAVSAQDKAPNFGGTWNLDVAKSKLGDRNTIESQTMTVTQTDKDIKIETKTTRKAPPEGAPTGGGRPGGGMGGGMMGGGDLPTTYTLDGKETKTEVQGPMGAMPVALKAKFEAGKLNLSRSSTFNGPMGEVTMMTKETWELSADGNTLTVNTERTTMRGNDTTTKVFAKKT
jgi:hypothetical protein